MADAAADAATIEWTIEPRPAAATGVPVPDLEVRARVQGPLGLDGHFDYVVYLGDLIGQDGEFNHYVVDENHVPSQWLSSPPAFSLAEAQTLCEQEAAELQTHPERYWRSDSRRTLDGCRPRPGLPELVVVGLEDLLRTWQRYGDPGVVPADKAEWRPAAPPTGPVPGHGPGTGEKRAGHGGDTLPDGVTHTAPSYPACGTMTALVLDAAHLPLPYGSELVNRASVTSPAFREFEQAMGFRLTDPLRAVLAVLAVLDRSASATTNYPTEFDPPPWAVY